ncbi:MAG TPA: hypothetical protein VM470_01675 [Acidimicrobiia bacterium]|nr:hypothetical protein [Acidimicrobiia bacterium]
MPRRLVLVLLGIVACTGPGSVTTIPTTAVPPTTNTTLTPQLAIADFSTCMEERGVVVPDLPIGENGRPDLGGLAIANDVSTSGFRAALNDCSPILAAAGLLDLTGQPELAAAVYRQLQRFAECMRGAGVEGFPDPSPDFAGGEPPFPLETLPRTDPELAGAVELCSTELGIAPITG